MNKEIVQKLKPCPFCGAGEDYLDITFFPPITVVVAFVECQKCNARGGIAKHSHLQNDESLEDKAKEFWNKRAKF